MKSSIYKTDISTFIASLLCLLLLSSCKEKVSSIALYGNALPIDGGQEVFIKNPKDMQVRDSFLFLLGSGEGKLITLFSYPDLRFLGRLCTEGRGPKEFLDIACFCTDEDSLSIIQTNTKDMLSIGLADVLQESPDAWHITRLSALQPPNLSYTKTDFGIVSVCAEGPRVRIIGDEIKNSDYSVPYDIPGMNNLFLNSMWSGPLAYSPENKLIVTATRLGDVLELISLPSLERQTIVGPGGYPDFLKVGNGFSLGKIDGFFDVQIAGNEIYALYSGADREEMSKALRSGESFPDGGRTLRVYDLGGNLLRQYDLDISIQGFHVDLDRKQILGFSNNSNDLFYSFNLPES